MVGATRILIAMLAIKMDVAGRQSFSGGSRRCRLVYFPETGVLMYGKIAQLHGMDDLFSLLAMLNPQCLNTGQELSERCKVTPTTSAMLI
jgi:hypothetical protein